jgi:hypothetical protein
LQQIQAVLGANNFGHGTININGTTTYGIDAFSGSVQGQNRTPIPGIPANAVFTVNDVAGFFNEYLSGNQLRLFEVGKRRYPGNSLRAQATILVHETAHQITVTGFEKDFGYPRVGRANDKLVDTNCRQLIEGLQ